jgi:hypothetical protein
MIILFNSNIAQRYYLGFSCHNPINILPIDPTLNAAKIGLGLFSRADPTGDSTESSYKKGESTMKRGCQRAYYMGSKIKRLGKIMTEISDEIKFNGIWDLSVIGKGLLYLYTDLVTKSTFTIRENDEASIREGLENLRKRFNKNV